jgi:hypothetical protein
MRWVDPERSLIEDDKGVSDCPRTARTLRELSKYAREKIAAAEGTGKDRDGGLPNSGIPSIIRHGS